MPSIPNYAGCCQRGPLLSDYIQNTDGLCMTGGERLGTQQPGVRNHQRDLNLTNHFADSITNPTHEPLGMPHLQNPPTDPWHTILHALNPHTNTLAKNSLSTLLKVVSADLCSWLVSMCKRLTQLCGIKRKHTNLGIQYFPRKNKRRLSASSLASQNPGKSHYLRNPHTKEEIRHVEQVYLFKKSTKASEFPAELTSEDICLLKPEEGDYFFKCEDINARL